ncbi:roquin-1a isoform X1 [Paramormyrops kingsleyae]|uniref:roquin-1a isoform X1 n=1 Tax=Paramormyrops kingsleyae TaxID=1676925 RepID=UPI000CD639D2|nr:roquin-1-like isoform X1 [Paramormyrops kingsleyae]XP_023669030.1 roquin-1-like isoform X1 [Paramormyrops kingsleyae]
MPVQAPQWTEFLSCPICTHTFEQTIRRPISLGCGHTVCKMCLNKLHRKACPFDQTAISTDIELLPVNTALLQLVGGQAPRQQPVSLLSGADDTKHYEEACRCVEELALYLKPLGGSSKGLVLSSPAQSMLSRPMQRKLVTLVHCQLVEEEGRVRAMRAARSLGERTVTELILQHQNPQQLSSNLWAAVRARGCQFLGPAMQEEALKLVLLALEDGSALSRKVLVLFVVQRLEPRFPQASKTSIGHVVQLLYRASCFKVTKRDEDSSLMQLKEEFRTYEALRREHDSQIVQIAMEGGLRIAPDQWSSLLYGDQSHKSHMQSIIDKLQTPASFAQSVQELTIALQRTGDPANLNRLRPHLELLADIDPSPDAPPPIWEQLDNGLVAVKTVVHGLVDFIQNHSKKGNDQQQPSQHSKYKTYMCRDMKQKGGCPRGASCTFAHSQEELDKYRKMSRRPPARRPHCPSMLPGGEAGLPDEDEVARDALARKSPGFSNGIIAAGPGSPLPQLISRGPSSCDPGRKPSRIDAGSPVAPGSPPDCLDPVPKTLVAMNHHLSNQRQTLTGHRQGTLVHRGPPMYPQQQAEVIYPEPRPPGSAMQYDSSHYPAGTPYPYQPSPYLPKRYLRTSSQASEPGLLPYQEPYAGPYVPERQYTTPQSGPQFSAMFHHYDARRPPPTSQSYLPRDDLVRMSPGPVDVPPPPPPPPPSTGSAYLQESSRELYSSDTYCPVGPHIQVRPWVKPNTIQDPYSRPQQSLGSLVQRRNELMAQLEEREVLSPPPFTPSPVLPHTFPNNYQRKYIEENSQGYGKCPEADYESQYSPWSCDTISSYISTKESKSKENVTASGMEMMNSESKGLREPVMDLQRRAAEAKDDDPIIPFGPQPTVSRFGAISRTSKMGYQTTGPIQAMASSQGSAAKHLTFAADYTYGNHGAWGGSASYAQHQNMASQGHFSERPPSLPTPTSDRELLKMELRQVNEQISQQTQMRGLEAASNTLLLQREAGPLAPSPGPGDWPAGGLSSEQLSLELHHVEREIGKRTREMALTTVSKASRRSKCRLASFLQENHLSHEVKFKMKPLENGQAEHDGQREDVPLGLGEVSNGSSSLPQDSSVTSLASRTSSLSLASDLGGGSSDLQKNGVVHSCS